MTVTIHERDIASSVCQACAACCRIKLKVSTTDSRYRRFLRQIGLVVYPEAKEGSLDCCNDKHEIYVDLGYCKHLRIMEKDDGKAYSCGVYGSKDFPELCAQFNCVSWAKTQNTYDDNNGLLVAAEQAMKRVRGGK